MERLRRVCEDENPAGCGAGFSFRRGEDEIRTRGAGCPARRFSKPVVSATHPPLQSCECVSPISADCGAKVSQKYGTTKYRGGKFRKNLRPRAEIGVNGGCG